MVKELKMKSYHLLDYDTRGWKNADSRRETAVKVIR
jgi:hypothetical protein